MQIIFKFKQLMQVDIYITVINEENSQRIGLNKELYNNFLFDHYVIKLSNIIKYLILQQADLHYSANTNQK